MTAFGQGQPSSSPCTQCCCLLQLRLFLFPEMLRALSLGGLAHLKPPKPASYLVWPTESARLPLLTSTACCCGFTGFPSVSLHLYDRTHVFIPPAFPSCGCCPPRHGHHTGQEQRGQYPLCTRVCEVRQRNLSGHTL